MATSFLNAADIEAFFKAFDIGWVVLSAVLTISVLLVGAVHRRMVLAWTVTAVIAAGSGAPWVLDAMRARWALELVTQNAFLWLVGLLESTMLLVFWVKICGRRRRWALPVALTGAAALLARSAYSPVMAQLFDFENFAPVHQGGWYSGVRYSLSTLSVGVSIALALGARTATLQAISLPESIAPAPTGEGSGDVLVGATLLLLGIGGSVASFALAGSNGGGRYVIATGAIVVGLVRLTRGIWKMSNPPAD